MTNIAVTNNHNLSLLDGQIGNNTQKVIGKININDKGCYQFDEILRNIDRQIETQINPAKTFDLSSTNSTPQKSIPMEQ